MCMPIRSRKRLFRYLTRLPLLETMLAFRLMVFSISSTEQPSCVEWGIAWLFHNLISLMIAQSFEERDTLNDKIVLAINDVVKDWGLKCLRYEISLLVGLEQLWR
ncbi:hypothetical protein H5410_033995 [Solanum commersonii]|uniref:Uncharacterized protein n=1 Tax=Solanum commersonii TaxID=4109 RepID=A0A9J5YQ69_SOLCO|nr:hypothetical protein H5410_033995 [Solanum commersonii]